MRDVLVRGEYLPGVVQGAMRIDKLEVKQIQELIDKQLELGANYWDHADVYGNGKCESLFGEAMKGMSGVRNKLILQSKCGVVPGEIPYYDLSTEHIIESVEGSLKRLGTDHLDYLLLHRPDILMDPEDVAEAFDQLYQQGKVLHFGVSNHTVEQIELLRSVSGRPIEINQMQFSLAHTTMIDSTIYANTAGEKAADKDSGILGYCRLSGIGLQCYSPFQDGAMEESFIDNPKFAKLNEVMTRLARAYQTSVNGIAAAWIFSHPADMQVVIGTTDISRLYEIAQASDRVLDRVDWYELYAATGHQLP